MGIPCGLSQMENQRRTPTGVRAPESPRQKPLSAPRRKVFESESDTQAFG